jgi:hypothetical protein
VAPSRHCSSSSPWRFCGRCSSRATRCAGNTSCRRPCQPPSAPRSSCRCSSCRRPS